MDSDMKEVIDQYLNEVLLELGSERSRNIVFTFIDVADPQSVFGGRVAVEGATEEAHFEIRLSRRGQSRPCRFTLQAMTLDLAPETGFAGFTADGRMQSPSGIEIHGRINRYNAFDWEPKLVNI
jgi:hypothetical protein